MKKSLKKVVVWLPLTAEGCTIFDSRGEPLCICDPDKAEEFIKRITTRYSNDLLTEKG